jgi:putative transposase
MSLGISRQCRRGRSRRSSDTGVRLRHGIAPNVLERAFTAAGPNQRWVADFTYVLATEGGLYVAVVPDRFSRRTVGWSMKAETTAQLVVDALMTVLWRRGRPRGLLHHSDQGNRYTSDPLQGLLAEAGITRSMNKRGDVWDNYAMESFFSSRWRQGTIARAAAVRASDSARSANSVIGLRWRRAARHTTYERV